MRAENTVNTKIQSCNQSKSFHLQPRGGHSSQTGYGMWWQSQLVAQTELLILCSTTHNNVSPLGILPSTLVTISKCKPTTPHMVTYLLLSGRPHLWQNSLFQCSADTILQWIRTTHIGAILNIYQTESSLCATKLLWGLLFQSKCFKKEGKALKQSRSGSFFKSSVRSKTQELLNLSLRNPFLTTARHEKLIPSSFVHQEIWLVYNTFRIWPLLATSMPPSCSQPWPSPT